MGKTGTTAWVQVKGVKGQIRLVPKSEGEVKRPGPNQRFKAGAQLKELDQGQESFGRGGRGRGGRGGGRGGARGGRGRGGEGVSTANPMVRRSMKRSKGSVMGAKTKAK